MLADALAGGHLIHDCGYLESGLTGSLAQLAICDEIAAWINAVDRARRRSPTRRWRSTSSTRSGPTAPILETRPHVRPTTASAGTRSLIDRRGIRGVARRRQRRPWPSGPRRRVEELLASHAPTPLDPDVEAAVRAVVERVQAAAGL